MLEKLLKTVKTVVLHKTVFLGFKFIDQNYYKQTKHGNNNWISYFFFTFTIKLKVFRKFPFKTRFNYIS